MSRVRIASVRRRLRAIHARCSPSSIRCELHGHGRVRLLQLGLLGDEWRMSNRLPHGPAATRGRPQCHELTAAFPAQGALGQRTIVAAT